MELIGTYEKPPPPSVEELLRAELAAMKPSGWTKRAVAAGATEDEAEEAGDADDPIDAFVTLIAACMQKADKAAQKAELMAELAGMKPSGRKKRAAAVGATKDAIDEATDADDPAEAFCELIMALEKKDGAGEPPEAATAASPAKRQPSPHYGLADPSGAGAVDTAADIDIFGNKHVILSYQWDAQEEVKVAQDMLKARGIPTWMDIDGGMQTNIYDSMAEGVGNAVVVVPFMTDKYESSINCKLELQFSQQTGVPICPVMMQADYSPRGWLGLLTAGILWTPMYDKASLEQNVDGLVRQIKLAVAPDAEQAQVQGISEAPDFSVEDLRDELDRLKDQNDQTVSVKQKSGQALVPAPVPELPRGVLVTQSMEALLLHLTSSDKSRILFLGMGA